MMTDQREHMPTTEMRAELRAFATQIAREAGDILQRMKSDARFSSIHKQTPTDVVTEADRAAEDYLVRVINTEYNTHGILGEEGTNQEGESDYRWVIDPLDGTLNYVRGIGAFGPIVSCEYHGIPVAAASYDVTTNQMWSAAAGMGVTMNDLPVHVSETDSLNACAVVIEGATDNSAQQHRSNIQESLVGYIGASRQLGSCAAQFGLVASGSIDAMYVNGGGRWDVSAGVLLVREAGGKVIATHDDSGRYIVACANPHVFDAFCQRLRFTTGTVFTEAF